MKEEILHMKEVRVSKKLLKNITALFCADDIIFLVALIILKKIQN